MNQFDRLLEILAAYKKHGWVMSRALLTDETRSLYEEHGASELEGVKLVTAGVDALWFSRPSHQQREAWELRLVAETPYALFETFAADMPEPEREAVRAEMEGRLQEYVSK
jgi:hypothetical protein